MKIKKVKLIDRNDKYTLYELTTEVRCGFLWHSTRELTRTVAESHGCHNFVSNSGCCLLGHFDNLSAAITQLKQNGDEFSIL
jgi:hypothetical protein